jgi:subtilisin family serine protease
MRSFFNNLFGRHSSQSARKNRRSSAPKARSRASLRMENLETRQLMAGDLRQDLPGLSLPAPGTNPPAYVGPVTPNDTRYGDLWGLNQSADHDIDAPEAWGWTTGGTKTTIAIVDTGVDYTHPDLAKNIWLNEGEIPASVRSHLTDVDNDGRITFWDLNEPVNQGQYKANDKNGNGFIDGGDLIARMFASTPPYKPGGDPNAPPTYVGGMADGLDNDGNGYTDDLIGWDFAGNDNNPMDGEGHGTHVAGTIGAVGNNSRGVTGINWKTQMMPLRIKLGESGAPAPTFGDVLANPGKYYDLMMQGQSQAIDAIHYAVANGAKVSNHSWGAELSDTQAMLEQVGGGLGFYEDFQDLKHAISDAKDAGHIVVMAAGNAHRNIDLHPSYPAGLGNSNMITVAATNTFDQRSDFSNYGATLVDLAAPGESILSTVPGGGYERMGGTSMAAPHVTGVVGLVWSMHPGWSWQQVLAQVENAVDPLPSLAGKVKTGGRLNALKAVTPGPWIVSPALNSSHEIDKPVSSVRVSFNQAISPSSFTTEDVAIATLLSGGPRSIPTFSHPITVTGVHVVPGTDNRQFDISFAGIGPATYRFLIGPNIKSQTGYLMDLDRDNTGGEATDDRHMFTIKMTMDYLKEVGPAADAERLRNFIETLTLVPKNVLVGKVMTTMVSKIIVHYSLPMNKAAATKLANFQVLVAGIDGRFGTADDKTIAISAASYNAAQKTVTLTPKSPLAQGQPFRVTLKGAGLIDSKARALDGNRDGVAGGDFSLDIARGTTISYLDQHGSQVTLTLSGGGTMELFLRPDGTAENLRLVGAVAGKSSLSATVQPASAASPAATTLGAITSKTGFINNLPASVRVGPQLDSAIDELFAKGAVIGRAAWRMV